MSAPQLHLALNHVPLFASILGVGFLLYGLARRQDGSRKRGLVTLILAALLAVPVYLSGEPTEAVVEGITGVSHARIHRHEEAAERAFVLLCVVGVAALAQLFVERAGRAVPRAVRWLTVLVAVWAAVAMGRVAHLGGEIRHGEIRRDAGQATQDVGLGPKSESHEDVDPD
jgi:hypothetical protein